jgi:hypothetical protein
MTPDDLFKPGDKVHYIAKHHDEITNGVLKSLCDDGLHAFVVYNCGRDWANYMDYTAARTPLKQLRKDWDYAYKY